MQSSLFFTGKIQASLVGNPQLARILLKDVLIEDFILLLKMIYNPSPRILNG